jgi:addiction module RelE/StbE family toxin
MALKLVWSENALEDLVGIATYIEKDSLQYAKAVVNTFFDKTDILIDFPLLGRVVPEYNEHSIRELFIYSYRLIYEVSSSQISIVTIIHGKKMI